MFDQFLQIKDLHVPRFLYGTAWKEDQTQQLTHLALQQGFRGIDTANQRRHYHEAAVGRALAEGIASGLVKREELFLQTKFTFRAGQDDRLPYDPKASISSQVEQSFSSSLQHLGVDTIDSYLLHGPSRRAGLADDDWKAWQAMEALHDSGRTRLLGVSNVTVEQLNLLLEKSRIKPTFVQNRCYAAHGWDYRVRKVCSMNEMVYQGFSLLTANTHVLTHPKMAEMAKQYDRPVTQIVFRFALEVGMQPLTGTSDSQHMKSNLDAFDFRLEPEEVTIIEGLIAKFDN